MKYQLPLHAGWQFFEPQSKSWLKAEVPGCIHTDLLKHGLIPDPFYGRNELDLQWIEDKDWTYRAEFEVPVELLEHENVSLVAEGLDTVATVYLNGKKIASVENMFIGYEWPVKERLRAGGNQLEIWFHSPMEYIRRHRLDHRPKEFNDRVGGCSRLRKMQSSFGWDWGPRFATSGIYKSLRLEGWSINRIESVQITQKHKRNRVDLEFHPELAVPHRETLRGRILLRGQVVTEIIKNRATIHDPELWWPNGHGAHPLYLVEVELIDQDQVLDRWVQRIGLRTLELDRHPDQWGQTFQFKVNGRIIFAKGANWIPAHSFVTTVTRGQYDELLTAATDAHMNMIRAWGGGIYEMEDFFDLCDEKGLLVWQDFMFACTLAPADQAFLDSVSLEAKYQIKRLRHRASLALWCGNNELVLLNREALKNPKSRARKDYDRLFHKLLPKVVKAFDGVTPYWPTSPYNPLGGGDEKSGDAHFWEVWHAGAPVKTYETRRFRFCSEFGMQSYSSPEIAATYCPPEELNILSATMENHQKHSGGNRIIFNYVSQRYRFPKDYASLSYLSQLNQAYCMKVGVEHFRRCMPRTMGALYWQLNDCWPVFSWSSLEFGGRWKALHFEARRFFSPALVSADIHGDVKLGMLNHIENTIRQVDLYTVYDAPEAAEGLLQWELRHLDDSVLWRKQRPVKLKPNASVKQVSLDFSKELKSHASDCLYLTVSLIVAGAIVSRQTVLFSQPRFIKLCDPKIQVKVETSTTGRSRLTFSASHYAHQVGFHPRDICYQASDNFFDLWPDIPHVVEIVTPTSMASSELRQLLTWRSLYDSY
jgi:beta-mannosidase